MKYEEIKEDMKEFIGADVKKFTEPVELYRSDFEKLGRKAQIEYDILKIEKITIGGYWFGLCRFFSVDTQHCYCDKDDMHYILGMIKYVKDKQNKAVHTFYSDLDTAAIEYARQMEYKHMERVYKALFGKEWQGEKNEDLLYKEMDKKYLVGNYFYWYRMYIYKMRYYELLLGIK